MNLPLVFVTGEADLRLEPAAITHQFLRRGPSPGEVDRLVAAPPLTQRASLPAMAPCLAALAFMRDLDGLDRGARRAAPARRGG